MPDVKIQKYIALNTLITLNHNEFVNRFCLKIKTMLGFAEAQCSNEETASPEGCKELLDEEEFVTERKNYIFKDLRQFVFFPINILNTNSIILHFISDRNL